jgi:hypothetical protein
MCSPFLYGRNLECLIIIPICELYLNFHNFETFQDFEGEKWVTARSSLWHSLPARLPTMKPPIMARRID